MEIIIRTTHCINRVNSTVKEVLNKMPEAITTTKAIHNFQAFQALSYKE